MCLVCVCVCVCACDVLWGSAKVSCVSSPERPHQFLGRGKFLDLVNSVPGLLMIKIISIDPTLQTEDLIVAKLGSHVLLIVEPAFDLDLLALGGGGEDLNPLHEECLQEHFCTEMLSI